MVKVRNVMRELILNVCMHVCIYNPCFNHAYQYTLLIITNTVRTRRVKGMMTALSNSVAPTKPVPVLVVGVVEDAVVEDAVPMLDPLLDEVLVLNSLSRSSRRCLQSLLNL